MPGKGAFPRSLNIVIVLAMILSTLTALAIPSETGRAAENGLKGLESEAGSSIKALPNKSGVQAALLLDENFDYGDTAGDLTAVSGGNWIAHSAAGLYPVGYATNSLEMPSYVSSGIAGSATITAGGSREDVNRTLTITQTEGIVYYAALVNISQASTVGDYILHFKNQGTGFAGRLFARDSGTGALQFGVGTSGAVYGTTNFSYYTTYLAVVKHDIGTGASDVFILDSCTNTEPAPLAEASGTGLNPIVAIAIRQGSNVVGGIDGIRVANDWAGAVVCTTTPPGMMTIDKTAPARVIVNQSFDYSLSIGNLLGMTANNVVITDSLPAEVTFESASDGGTLVDTNVVSWTVPSLADGETIERTVSVLAPSSETSIVNADYGVSASNWITVTVGNPVTTTVSNPDLVTPIAEARAAGAGWYGTIEGNVTVVPGTFAARSFTIQDDTGGMYVYPASTIVAPPMVLGDVLRVKGTIKNYNGLLEIDPVESIIWIDTSSVPDALAVPVNALGPNQGKLVTIQGTALSMTGTTNKTIKFQDASGSTTVYIYGLSGIDTSSFSFPMPMRVTGMSGAYNSLQVNPRYQSDIIDLRPPTVTGTVPADGASDVNPYKPLAATFSKAMDGTTITPATFLLEDADGPVVGTTGYDEATHTTSFTPAAALAPFTEYTATLTSAIADSNGIFLIDDYAWNFTTGADDKTPPAVVGYFPPSDAVDVLLRSNVVITFTEDLRPDSLNQEHFTLQGPYGAVPKNLTYNSSTFVVSLDPETSLLPTTLFTVTVSGDTTDWAGNPLGADVTWNFTTQVEPPMQVFFGDIHNHTSYSDGSGTPAEALAAGEAAGFDFMAISDHSYAISDFEWEDTLDAVETMTVPGEFIALRGFEYTQGAEGHVNVYNTVRHAVRTDTGCSYCDYTPNLEAGATVEGFYQWAASEGLIGLDDAGTVLQFNHPGWINFNDWTYHPEVSDIARLEEVGNGNGTSYAFSEDQYIRSLDYGWKVGATNNADTHTSYWGTNTEHRTGVLMTELTKKALLEALSLRRTFATEDKNFSLTMKANGAWMGSEIANSGQILFEITGDDPDGELPSLVQIITDQGKVVAEFEPDSASFSWSPLLDISTGVHYFYVKVTQVDGDRIVSSPVWTLGSEDISITDLVIEPTIPTIYNQSLITVRVTNRNTAARTVTVMLDVNGAPIGTPIVVNVPGNGDSFATFNWQPTETGLVTITAQISGAPAGDNPDDNSSVLELTVTDEQLPLILIDASHGNLNATGNEMEMFFKDLSDHRYNVLKNLDELTSSDLNPQVVKLLLITAPQYPYTASELEAISNYVDAGGSLWLVGMSDYPGSVPWAATVADRENAILAAIEGRTGSNINMRFNDDEIIDANDNNGYIFGPIWHNFPSEYDTSIGINVEALSSWSVASLRGRTPGTPLTADTPGVQIVIQGDLDTGYTVYNTYSDPNHTSNTDADGGGDAYIYNPSWVYPWDTVPEGAIPLPMAAVTQLPDGAGRILLYGDSNDAFTTYAYTAGDGKQNELFNLQAAMWLMGEPLQKSTIAEARAQAVVNQPNNRDKLVWVEGEITAAYGEFFNVLYVQDETGGITVHAPAGDIDPSAYSRGTHVRVVGTVGIYNGDTEIEFFEAEMVQVIEPSTGEPELLPMTTYEASLEDNQGWLSVITGTVTSKVGNDNIFVDDGSGSVRIFLDGYNGNFDDIQLNDRVQVIGLVSEDGDGQRIRVRNHDMHPEYADDVIKLPQALNLDITKIVTIPQEIAQPGDLITYTIIVTNTSPVIAVDVHIWDMLPDYVVGTDVDLTTNISTGSAYTITIPARLALDVPLGSTIVNTAYYENNVLSGETTASFDVSSGVPALGITKTVETPGASVLPGDPITYTVQVSNEGTADAVNVHIWDFLPEGVIGEDVNITVTIPIGEAYTISIPATLAADVTRGATITNTAYYASGEFSGEASASVMVAPAYRTYLPLSRK